MLQNVSTVSPAAPRLVRVLKQDYCERGGYGVVETACAQRGDEIRERRTAARNLGHDAADDVEARKIESILPQPADKHAAANGDYWPQQLHSERRGEVAGWRVAQDRPEGTQRVVWDGRAAACGGNELAD